MLDKRIYEIEYIKELQEKYKKDPALLERVLYAFGLLEAIAQVGLPFVFKGGSCLMLLLDHPMRLSTDIDIIVRPGTDVDTYIREAAKIFPFVSYEEQIRIGRNKIEKRHFRFIYQSPTQKRVFYILLDVLFDEPPYMEMVQKEIRNDLLIVKDSPMFVTVPSIECILGDKMTAFAPHTTGILYGTGKSMEIMKQMFDIETLIGEMDDQDIIKQTYETAVKMEMEYRGLELTKEDVLRDSIKALSCIIGRGSVLNEEYGEYLKGIRSVASHIMEEGYDGELAAFQACRVMYFAACLLTGETYKPILHPEQYINESIGKSKYKKLSYMKKQKLECYACLVEAIRLLDE